MTILIVLLGLLLSHLVRPVSRLRRFGWFGRLLGALRRSRLGGAAPAPAIAVVVVALALALALDWLAYSWLGWPGWFFAALAVFVYSLGPRDLDHDVQILMAGGNDPRYLKVRRIMRIQRDAGAPEAAAALFHAAQARWFGALFWFVLLGIPGVLLYRLTRISLNLPGLAPAQSGWLLRLRDVLDWPVLLLMLISAGLGGDYDRVRHAWHAHRQGRSPWTLQPEVLDEVGAVIVDSRASFEEGVTTGHHIVWRMLMIWLVALSLILIAGWLS